MGGEPFKSLSDRDAALSTKKLVWCLQQSRFLLSLLKSIWANNYHTSWTFTNFLLKSWMKTNAFSIKLYIASHSQISLYIKWTSINMFFSSAQLHWNLLSLYTWTWELLHMESLSSFCRKKSVRDSNLKGVSHLIRK